MELSREGANMWILGETIDQILGDFSYVHLDLLILYFCSKTNISLIYSAECSFFSWFDCIAIYENYDLWNIFCCNF